MRSGRTPVVPPRHRRRWEGSGEAHLIAIAMNDRGLPTALFTTASASTPGRQGRSSN
jgi:hypothetical protein